MIEPDDLRRAQEESSRSGVSIGAAILKLGLIDERKLTEFLARQYGVPAVDLKTRAIAESATGLIGREVALRFLTIPLERHGSVLVVAMADPSNLWAREELVRTTGLDIEVVVSSEPALRAAIDAHYPVVR